MHRKVYWLPALRLPYRKVTAYLSNCIWNVWTKPKMVDVAIAFAYALVIASRSDGFPIEQKSSVECDTESQVHTCGFRFRRPQYSLITMAWPINLSRSTTERLGILCCNCGERRVHSLARKSRDKVIWETNAVHRRSVGRGGNAATMPETVHGEAIYRSACL